MTNKPEKMYQVREVAELFAVTSETIRDWIASGQLRAIKIGRGHYWRVPESAVIELANRKYGDPNVQEAKAPAGAHLDRPGDDRTGG